MNRDKLQTAIQEAERFLDRARHLPEYIPDGRYYENNHPKERGAIRRASMDLTRALADLRRGDG